MYHYNDFDKAAVTDRVSTFREQVAQRLDGSITEDEFNPLPPDERALSATARLYAARGDPLWHAERRPDAGAGR